MFVPSTRERQKIPVSQITRGPNTAQTLLFMQSNYHSRKDIGAPCWDLPMGETQNEEIGIRGSESIPSLAVSVRPIYYEKAPQWPHSTF
jgi:hypothetical protein